MGGGARRCPQAATRFACRCPEAAAAPLAHRWRKGEGIGGTSGRPSAGAGPFFRGSCARTAALLLPRDRGAFLTCRGRKREKQVPGRGGLKPGVWARQSIGAGTLGLLGNAG